ncbi:Protein dom-3 [Aphelenchoides avenae]|nr:Protein dom-3 [Aphelenchus avenae]
MAAATDEMPTTPDAYAGSFDLQDVEPIGDFSRIGPDGQRIAFDSSKIRYCNLLVDENINEPRSHRGSFGQSLTEGFEQYVRRQDAGNRTDPLCEWAIALSDFDNMPLNDVTMGSEVMTDRSTLMKIAATPYVQHCYGWKLDAFRIGSTLLVCPHAIEEEERFYTEGGLKSTFGLDVVKSLISESGHGVGEQISTANSYHRVMTSNLTDGGARPQASVCRPTENPIEVRIEFQGKLGSKWFVKALKWYIMSRLSGSRQLLLGVRTADDVLSGIEQLPTDFIRTNAERNRAWDAQTCFTFLYEVLARMRSLLEGKPDGQRLTVSYSPKDPKVRFKVHEACDPRQLFVSREFWQKFAVQTVA